ncbi:DUF6460 domain-containing protein [Aurantimonas sp. C2-6-R+9]|uniref:DUF6460 domain-containing protein n=1 Tax=unclassified Aurantimonas TaxID=2638230 RepID=UPI002E195E0E|nr:MULTISPECIES: DUF6460 domain-containing protein [unclassified Aurantimonas]MEC5291871.1 DUF6460 domain-containing protein [Aurantimonas sp. C2-3-R2]MEC5379909.1 DUF6460 domain-containing protein [Aurantimonas sp. C2-6-R+9]MEC5412957.1 DUF6460 domain-containing protein [Aurantimonas sp. C2-4-R8]
MSERVNSFLGGSPLGVIVKLVLLSIVVGVILSWLQWSPANVVDWVVDLFQWLWGSVFGSLERAIDYFILGAAIVVPIFIISRLLTLGRR